MLTLFLSNFQLFPNYSKLILLVAENEKEFFFSLFTYIWYMRLSGYFINYRTTDTTYKNENIISSNFNRNLQYTSADDCWWLNGKHKTYKIQLFWIVWFKNDLNLPDNTKVLAIFWSSIRIKIIIEWRISEPKMEHEEYGARGYGVMSEAILTLLDALIGGKTYAWKCTTCVNFQIYFCLFTCDVQAKHSHTF